MTPGSRDPRRVPLLPRRAALRLAGRTITLGPLVLAGCAGDARRGTSPTVAAVEQSSPTPSPAPTDVPFPDGPDEPNAIVIEVLGEPPEDQRVLVEYAAGLARDFFFRELGLYLDGPVRITVVDMPDLPVHAATFLRDGARISAITVNVGQRTWELRTPLERIKIVAHEYFHVLENWLRGSTDTSLDPMFLVEGTAEYAGYASVIDAGQLTIEEFRSDVLEAIRRQGVRLPPLDRLTGDTPFALTAYALAALAVDWLVGDRGIAPVARYTMLRRNLAPDEAFEAVFGRTLESFYLEITQWRRAVGV